MDAPFHQLNLKEGPKRILFQHMDWSSPTRSYVQYLPRTASQTVHQYHQHPHLTPAPIPPMSIDNLLVSCTSVLFSHPN